GGEVGAGGGLVGWERRDPGVVTFERLGEWLDLANAAAEVGVAFVKALAVNPVLLFNAQPGAALDDVQSVARAQPLFQLVGLGELKAGLQIDDRRFTRDTRQA